jgi:dipeptidyl aminopeptidase/acylaminoacyl peptidase
VPAAVSAPDRAAVVNVESLNVRAGPGTNYAVVGVLQQNRTIGLTARNEAGDWLQIEWTDAPDGYGWVYTALLTTSFTINTLPISTQISAQPLPAATSPAPSAASRQTTPVVGLRGTLVFQEHSGGTIYRYNLQSGQIAPLTYGADPAISPDGQTVAFVRGGGEMGIYLINIDGSNERRIFGGNRPAAPKWSSDGQSIVFNHVTGQADPCRQTAMFGCVPQSQINELLEQIGDQLPADFDLERWPLVQPSYQNLSLIDPHGAGYRDLNSLQSVTAQDWGAWGIVYQSQSGLEITEGVDLSITRNLVTNHRYQDPDWQPGGDRILFQSREGSHWEILNINSDGGGIFALTRPPLFATIQPHHVAPAWSPDGQWVVFISNRSGEWALWVMDGNGGSLQQLPLDLSIDYSYQAEQVVSWGP